MDKQYDAVIVGGSFAGLSAAIYLARANRSVLILDTGAPRNRFAEESHGFFAHDGSHPGTLIAAMREQVLAYPTVNFLDRRASNATRTEDGVLIEVEAADPVRSRTILLAHGLSDILPALPGLAERWGRTVLHCPYCHGYEFNGKRLGVLNMSPMSIHQATLIPEWGPTTFFLDGAKIDDEAAATLAARGVAIEPARVTGLVGDGHSLSAVALEDGRGIAVDAMYVGPRYRLNSDIAARLGCAIEEGPLGPIVAVDEMKATNVPGVFAAGDITRAGHTVTFACSDGAMAGLSMHRSLVFGDAL